MTFRTVDVNGQPEGEIVTNCDLELPGKRFFTFKLSHAQQSVEFRMTPNVAIAYWQAINAVLGDSKKESTRA